MSILNKDIVQQTLRGYAEANEIASAERAAALAQLTRQESWAAFDALYTAWQRTGQRAGGDWEALAKQRIAEAIAFREAFETFRLDARQQHSGMTTNFVLLAASRR